MAHEHAIEIAVAASQAVFDEVARATYDPSCAWFDECLSSEQGDALSLLPAPPEFEEGECRGGRELPGVDLIEGACPLRIDHVGGQPIGYSTGGLEIPRSDVAIGQPPGHGMSFPLAHLSSCDSIHSIVRLDRVRF
jgi:hypothetical protein